MTLVARTLAVALIVLTAFLYYQQPRGEDWEMVYIFAALSWLAILSYWLTSLRNH